MRNKNTLGKREYLVYSTLFSVWFWVLYQNIFFRCLPNTTASDSRLILGVFAVITTTIGYGMTARRRRNFLSASINSMLPFSVYWLVTYHKTYASLSVVVVVMTVLSPLVYFALTIGMYIRAKAKNLCKASVVKAVWTSFLNARTVAILCLGIVFTTGISTLFGFPLLQASTKAAVGYISANEFTIESETETLLTLSDGTWGQLTNTEKLNVLRFEDVCENSCKRDPGHNPGLAEKLLCCKQQTESDDNFDDQIKMVHCGFSFSFCVTLSGALQFQGDQS